MPAPHLSCPDSHGHFNSGRTAQVLRCVTPAPLRCTTQGARCPGAYGSHPQAYLARGRAGARCQPHLSCNAHLQTMPGRWQKAQGGQLLHTSSQSWPTVRRAALVLLVANFKRGKAPGCGRAMGRSGYRTVIAPALHWSLALDDPRARLSNLHIAEEATPVDRAHCSMPSLTESQWRIGPKQPSRFEIGQHRLRRRICGHPRSELVSNIHSLRRR